MPKSAVNGPRNVASPNCGKSIGSNIRPAIEPPNANTALVMPNPINNAFKCFIYFSYNPFLSHGVRPILMRSGLRMYKGHVLATAMVRMLIRADIRHKLLPMELEAK
jgi:hypothetical protein